jgi:hypothetical protein
MKQDLVYRIRGVLFCGIAGYHKPVRIPKPVHRRDMIRYAAIEH